MPTDLATLGIKIEASDIKRAIKQLDKLEKEGAKAERSTKKLTSSFNSMGTAITALATSLLVRRLIGTAAAFETMKVSLETVTGSAEKAQIAMDGIKLLAQSTPFSVQELTQSFIKLKGLGIAPTESSMISFGNTSSAMGKSLNDMIEAVADASTSEFERLKEFGIIARKQGDQVKFTFQGVTTTVKNSSKDIVDFLENIGNTKFAGATKKQMDTVAGSFSNAGDAVDNLIDKLGEGGLNTVVKELNLGFANLINNISEAFDDDASVRILEKQIDNITEKIFRLQSGIQDQQDNNFFEDIFLGTEKGALNQIKLFQDQLDVLTVKLAAAKKATVADQITQAGADGNAGKAQEKIAARLIEEQLIADAVAQLGLANLAEFEAEKLEAQAVADALALNATIDQEQLKMDALASMREQEALATSLARLNEEQRERIHQRAMKSIIMDSLGNLSSLMNAQSKKLFNIGKIASLSTAVIKGYESIVSSYAAGAKIGGPPVGAAFAATAGLATAVQIQNIRSQSFGGGGSVSAPSGGGGVSGISPQTPTVAPALGSQSQQFGGSFVVNVNGGLVNEDFLIDDLLPAMRNAIEQRDFTLIRNTSTNGQNLREDI